MRKRGNTVINSHSWTVKGINSGLFERGRTDTLTGATIGGSEK